MLLTQEQIQRLSKLTALTPHQELNISSVVDSFESLKNTDTSAVAGTSRSGKSTLSLRDDSVENANIADALLDCSHQRKAAHQIVLGGIIAGE